MGRSPTDFLRKHPVFTRTLVLGYTAFLCCLFFPLGSSPPLHRVHLLVLMFCACWRLYGPRRREASFFRVLTLARRVLAGVSILSLMGSSATVSNTAISPQKNVLFLFLLTVPAGMGPPGIPFSLKFLLSSLRGRAQSC